MKQNSSPTQFKALKYTLYLLVIGFTMLISLMLYQTLLQEKNYILLSQPNMSDTAILVWANEAAVRVDTVNYLTYRRDLNQMQSYFTPLGWQHYKHTLDTMSYQAQLIQQKMQVSAVAIDVPVLLKQGLVNHYYTWLVQIPLLVHFESNSKILKKYRIVRLVIRRTLNHLGERGVGIVSIQEHDIPTSQSLNGALSIKQSANLSINPAYSKPNRTYQVSIVKPLVKGHMLRQLNVKT